MDRKNENLVGKKFGLLLVESFVFRKQYRNYWKCRCLCGKSVIICDQKIKKNYSCGCRKNILPKQGDIFGHFLILGDFKYENKKYEWLCKCVICKKEKWINEYALTNDKNRYNVSKNKDKCSCGKNIVIGQTFGRLVVEKLAEEKIRKDTQRWLCKCDCGNNKILSAQHLWRNGENISCGCNNKETRTLKENLIGKKFGKLTVIQLKEKKKGSNYWDCICECGQHTTIQTSHLGKTQSCGCLWRQAITKHGLFGKPGYSKFLRSDPIRKLKNNISTSIRDALKRQCVKKGGSKTFDYLPYTAEDLKKHLESLWEPWMNWDNYGGLMGERRKTWWIDHIKPHSLFNYKKMDDKEFKECWSLSNLRPLEKVENNKKRAKFIF